MAFDAYSRYYDLLYRDKDYAAEAQYVAGALRRHAPQAKRLLELGCGTGGHAEHLARAGYAVDGFDVSDTMLARAAARRATLPPEVAARLSFGRGAGCFKAACKNCLLSAMMPISGREFWPMFSSAASI